MNQLILIACGGALGATSRYGVVRCFTRLLGPDFPYGTMVVNILGSFLMGLIVGIGAHYFSFGEHVKAAVIIGFLGSFTTFSTFSLNLVNLAERGDLTGVVGYFLGSVILSVLALMGGIWITRIGGGA